MYLQPTAPTGDFSPVVTGSRSLGRLANRAIGRFALRMADRVYEPAVAQLRRRLALPAVSASEMRRRQERANWPVLHGFSTALVPRPSDWRPGLNVVGNWWPHHDPADRLPSGLEDFLSAGPRPVLVGFGSMASGDGERLSDIAVRTLRRAGLRGILQAGSAGLSAEGDDLFTIGDVRAPCCFRDWPRWSTTAGPALPPPRYAPGCPPSPCRSPRTSRSGRSASPPSVPPPTRSPSDPSLPKGSPAPFTRW
ncbi:hypothetical protein SAMN02745830_06047 [Streptomyces sp. Amel2xC10]|nr:hypothetical protein SAMN02745830_06047 [Streptomyces sp. Amel2xC10]